MHTMRRGSFAAAFDARFFSKNKVLLMDASPSLGEASSTSTMTLNEGNHDDIDNDVPAGLNNEVDLRHLRRLSSNDNLQREYQDRRKQRQKRRNSDFTTMRFLSSDRKSASTVAFVMILEVYGRDAIEFVEGRSDQRLSEVIEPYLERHSLTSSSVQLFIQGSSSPIPQDATIEPLGDQVIYAKKSGESISGSSTAISRNSRKSDKRNSASGDRLDKLAESLSRFSVSESLPPLPAHIQVDLIDLSGDELKLESEWTKVVTGHENMSIRRQKQQAAIWELLSTEVNFINQIRNMLTVYVSVFYEIHKNFLTDVSGHLVFSNLDEVLSANCCLWRDYLSKPLKHSRETREFLQPSLFKEGFFKIQDLLHPYTRFCIEVSECRRYIQKLERDNHAFSAYLQWTSLSSRESLCDQLAKPFQRLTKYKPILESIKKNTVDKEGVEDLEEMIKAVSVFVKEVDDDVHRADLRAKIDDLDSRIENYETVEMPSEEIGRFYRNFNSFKTNQPMPNLSRKMVREILFNGMLKLKEGQGKPYDVHCFLLTDSLLITKSLKNKTSDKLKIVKSPYRLDKIECRLASDNGSFSVAVLSDFYCISSLYVFTSDAKKCEEWVTQIKAAKKHYKYLRETHDSSSLGSTRPPFLSTSSIHSASRSSHHQSSLSLDFPSSTPPSCLTPSPSTTDIQSFNPPPSPRSIGRAFSAQTPGTEPRVFDLRHRAATFSTDSCNHTRESPLSSPSGINPRFFLSEAPQLTSSSSGYNSQSPVPGGTNLLASFKKIMSPIDRKKSRTQDSPSSPCDSRRSTPPPTISINDGFEDLENIMSGTSAEDNAIEPPLAVVQPGRHSPSAGPLFTHSSTRIRGRKDRRSKTDPASTTFTGSQDKFSMDAQSIITIDGVTTSSSTVNGTNIIKHNSCPIPSSASGYRSPTIVSPEMRVSGTSMESSSGFSSSGSVVNSYENVQNNTSNASSASSLSNDNTIHLGEDSCTQFSTPTECPSPSSSPNHVISRGQQTTQSPSNRISDTQERRSKLYEKRSTHHPSFINNNNNSPTPSGRHPFLTATHFSGTHSMLNQRRASRSLSDLSKLTSLVGHIVEEKDEEQPYMSLKVPTANDDDGNATESSSVITMEGDEGSDFEVSSFKLGNSELQALDVTRSSSSSIPLETTNENHHSIPLETTNENHHSIPLETTNENHQAEPISMM